MEDSNLDNISENGTVSAGTVMTDYSEQLIQIYEMQKAQYTLQLYVLGLVVAVAITVLFYKFIRLCF